jgi:hypothetical protein
MEKSQKKISEHLTSTQKYQTAMVEYFQNYTPKEDTSNIETIAYQQHVRSIHSLLSDIFGVTHNYTTVQLLYFATLHHCRNTENRTNGESI